MESLQSFQELLQRKHIEKMPKAFELHTPPKRLALKMKQKSKDSKEVQI